MTFTHSFSAKFLQGFKIDLDRVKLEFPNYDPLSCVPSICRCLPRWTYDCLSVGLSGGESILVIVLKTGDDEKYLRENFEIPKDPSVKQALELCLTPGVWPIHP
jgi:hypothetical protein